jgi:hypothetical protein
VSSWTDPVWLAEVHEWISGQLERLGTVVAGPIEQPHIRPWATVLRVPTALGDLYFKANAATFRHEAALATLLTARRPDCIPPLLAVERERGWMLMADAGTRLREIVERERDLNRWLEILPLYAGLQIELANDVDELLAMGVPDLRLATLAARYEQLLEDLIELPADDRCDLEAKVPWVRESCDELDAFGVPETIQHDDFHDGQVYIRDGRYLLLDWAEACVSHPFFTLSVTLEGGLAWGLDDVQGSVDVQPFRDAYLAPFRPFAGTADLDAAAAIAMRLGWVCRAVNAHVHTAETQTHTRLRMFLTGCP